MPPPPDRQCNHVRGSGERCRGTARTGREFCFTHDPESAAEREAARRAGGRQRQRQPAVLPGAQDVTFGGISDVTGLLAATASQVRRGEVDCRVGNCLCYIAATALKALAQGDIEERLKLLEQQFDAAKKGEGK